MLKTKYERMSKEEKKKIQEEYKKTEKGNIMLNRLLRIKIIGFLCLIYSIFYIITEFNNWSWVQYCVIIPLLLASFIFLYMSNHLKKKVLNQYAIKNKK